MVPLIIGRLAGVTWSVPENTFKVSDHLPESWDYVHTFTPVKQGQKVNWCEVKVTRKKKWWNIAKEITVKSCPLENIVIEPWLEGRELIKSTPSISKNKTLQSGHAAYEFSNRDNAKVTVKLGDRERSVPLLVRVTPFDRLFVDDITIDAEPMMDGCHVRYTVDGSEPTDKSALYRKPMTFDKSVTLKVRAFRKGDTSGPVVTADIVKAKAFDPTVLSKPHQGLRYEYYEGNWKKLPDFDKLKAVSKGNIDDFDLSIAKRPENFAIRYTGYLEVPEQDVYYFNSPS